MNKKSTIYIDIDDDNKTLNKKEYQRHIDAWTVRGHYRRTVNGKTWVKSHIKGNGNVELRTYGFDRRMVSIKNIRVFNVMFKSRKKNFAIEKKSIIARFFNWIMKKRLILRS